MSNTSHEDQAIVTAVSYLYRSLGTIVGLAFISSALQQILKSSLSNALEDSTDVEEIVRCVRNSLDCVAELEPGMQGIVRLAYSNTLIWAFAMMTGFMVIAFGSSCECFLEVPLIGLGCRLLAVLLS